MKREEIIEWLVAQGFLQSSRSSELYHSYNLPNVRYRVTKMGLKLERKDRNGTWFRALSGRYKNLSLDRKGLMLGLTGKGM